MGRNRSQEEEKKLRSDCRFAEKQAEDASTGATAHPGTNWEITASKKWKACSECFHFLGAHLSSQGQHEEAIEAHEKAASAAKNAGDKMEEALAYRNIADIHTDLGEHRKAEEWGERYFNLVREEGDSCSVQLAHHVLGRIYWIWASALEDNEILYQNKLKKAWSYLKESEAMIRKDQMRKDWKGELSRVLMNLGNVSCSQDKEEEGHNYFKEALHLARAIKDHKLVEQIHFARADIYYQAGEVELAEEEAKRSLAQAQSLAPKEAKEGKHQVWMLLGKISLRKDCYMDAGRRFVRAHKLKLQEDQATDSSKNLMKLAHKLQSLRLKLDELDSWDHEKRRKIFEKMADHLASQECFKMACRNYKRMLEETRLSSLGDEDYVPCYVSLAQTYKDDHDYRKALEYFKMLIALEKGKPEDEAKTALEIAQCAARIPDISVIETVGYFEAAADYSEESGNERLIGEVFFAWHGYLKEEEERQKLYAYERVLGKLKEMGGKFPRLESGEEEEIDTGNDTEESEVDTDTVVEDLASSDEELPESLPRNRITLVSKKKIKRNEKGESSLHIAARDGKVKNVRMLLKQGHLNLVNNADNNDWRPLHEAASFGRDDIVRILLDAGAEINALGGDMKDVTPLMDAAMGGDIRVMKTLINREACLVRRDHNGMNAADLLSHFLFNNKNSEDPLDKEAERKYRHFLSYLDRVLEKSMPEADQ